jgi:hypothetical protein
MRRASGKLTVTGSAGAGSSKRLNEGTVAFFRGTIEEWHKASLPVKFVHSPNHRVFLWLEASGGMAARSGQP